MKYNKRDNLSPSRKACELKLYYYRRLKVLQNEISTLSQPEQVEKIRKFAWTIHKKFCIEMRDDDKLIFDYMHRTHHGRVLENFLKQHGFSEILDQIYIKYQ